MKLREYLDEYSTPIRALARKAGIAHTSISNILKGMDIRLSIALKLEDATKGLVTCRELAPKCYKINKDIKKEENKRINKTKKN